MRRAGYPSDSSRAALQQTRIRPAGGGQLLYVYVVDRPRHLRHRSLPHCSRSAAGRFRRSRTSPCLPVRRTHRHRPRPPQQPGRGAPPTTTHLRFREPASTTALGSRCRLGRCRTTRGTQSRAPVGRLTVPHVVDRRAARAARGTDRRTASPPRGRAPGART